MSCAIFDHHYAPQPVVSLSVHTFPFPLAFFCLFLGTRRICLLILNQPLDTEYLHILWSKGIFHTSPLNVTWFALSMYSPGAFRQTEPVCFPLCKVLINIMSLKMPPLCPLPTFPVRCVLMKLKYPALLDKNVFN